MTPTSYLELIKLFTDLLGTQLVPSGFGSRLCLNETLEMVASEAGGDQFCTSS